MAIQTKLEIGDWVLTGYYTRFPSGLPLWECPSSWIGIGCVVEIVVADGGAKRHGYCYVLKAYANRRSHQRAAYHQDNVRKIPEDAVPMWALRLNL